MLADEQISKTEAASKYWKTHNFDPVRCTFYDEEKEKKFLEDRDAAALIHGKDQVKKLPITVQNEGLMFNPINMKIEDEKRLYERDLREKNKKARYEVRYDVEELNRKASMAEQDRQELMSINKISGQRFREELKRGHHILSNDPLDGKDFQYKRGMCEDNQKPYDAWNAAYTVRDEAEALEDAPAQSEKQASRRSGAPAAADEAPVSHHSKKPSSIAASKPPRSQAAVSNAQIPRSHASNASKPASIGVKSNASNNQIRAASLKASSNRFSRASQQQEEAQPASRAVSLMQSQKSGTNSRREIRTGGF